MVGYGFVKHSIWELPLLIYGNYFFIGLRDNTIKID